MNYDEFEPTDIGRCGEPYAPLPVCDKTYGDEHVLVGLQPVGELVERHSHLNADVGDEVLIENQRVT